ncbi:MAG: hypothetical protein KKI07_02975 [Euryarchaeota archaeon]|nr:hypothetical protein [Euryarchaeota archaeon]
MTNRSIAFWIAIWTTFIISAPLVTSALMTMTRMNLQKAIGFVATYGVFLSIATAMLTWEPSTRSNDVI